MRRRNGLRQYRIESFPDDQQLRFGAVQHRGKLHIDTRPVGVRHQLRGLVLPVAYIGGQGTLRHLRVLPWLGGHHLDALRQQHRRFTLHLRLMLQVLNDADAIGQLQFQACQRLSAQWRTGFGRIALPSQCVGDIELA